MDPPFVSGDSIKAGTIMNNNGFGKNIMGQISFGFRLIQKCLKAGKSLGIFFEALTTLYIFGSHGGFL